MHSSPSSSSGNMNRNRTRSMPAAATSTTTKRSLIDRMILKRSQSVPVGAVAQHRVVPGIMVIPTLEESLHSSYGRSTGGDERNLSDSQRRRLQFADLHIREYSRQVGDNPSVSGGPPLSLGWRYAEARTISLDEYESQRGPRRSSPEMAVPRSIRDEVLRCEWDVPRSEMAQAVRDVVRTKNRRRTTVQNLGRFARVEEAAESAKRKVKRFVLRRKRDSALYDEWASGDAERARAGAVIAEENAAAAAVVDAEDYADSSARPPSALPSSRLDASARRGRIKAESLLRGDGENQTVQIVVREAEDTDNIVDTDLPARDPAVETAPRRLSSSGAKIAPSSGAPPPPQKLIVCSEDDDRPRKFTQQAPREKTSEQSSGASTYEAIDPIKTSHGPTCA